MTKEKLQAILHGLPTGTLIYVRQGDDAEALAAFERGFAFGSGKAFHYADAAYAAKRSGDKATSNALKLVLNSCFGAYNYG